MGKATLRAFAAAAGVEDLTIIYDQPNLPSKDDDPSEVRRMVLECEELMQNFGADVPKDV